MSRRIGRREAVGRLTGFYQAFLFVLLAGYLLGSLPWLDMARTLPGRVPLFWRDQLSRRKNAFHLALIFMAGELGLGVCTALLAQAVTGSAVGVAAGGLAALLGSQSPAFSRLRRLPFHYLPLGRVALKVDRTLLITVGVLLVAVPGAAGPFVAAWAVAVLVTGYAPTGAVLAALALPTLLWRLTGYDLWVLFGLAAATIAIYQEIPYLLRTRRGQEPPLLTPSAGLPRLELPHRRSRRATLFARALFLAGAAVLLGVILLNRYVYQGFGHQAGIFRRGNPDLPYVALTFDDGPDPRYTPEVLRILREAEVPATFFLVGAHAARHPELTRRIREEGHEVASHTYSHRNLLLMAPGLVEQEVVKTEDVLKRVTGERPRLFRPPRGLYNRSLQKVLAERRYTTVLWSVSSRDWIEPSPRLIARNVLGPVRGGDIVLFHDSGAILTSEGGDRRHMLQALPYIIRQLKAEGFRFVTVSQLLLIAGLTSGGEAPPP